MKLPSAREILQPLRQPFRRRLTMGRTPFWIFYLLAVTLLSLVPLAGIVVEALAATLLPGVAPALGQVATLPVFLWIAIALFAAMARRLRDAGGWPGAPLFFLLLCGLGILSGIRDGLQEVADPAMRAAPHLAPHSQALLLSPALPAIYMIFHLVRPSRRRAGAGLRFPFLTARTDLLSERTSGCATSSSFADRKAAAEPASSTRKS